MNKKYLNAILFGVLALSTATFTGCKDYDDDIDSLNERVDAVEKSISDLESDFGALSYVSGVSYNDATRTLTVTTSSGSTQSYVISDSDTVTEDTNTTYTLTSTTSGNTTTITLTGSNGATSSVTVTDTQTEAFDPTSLFVKSIDGVNTVCYGDPDGEYTATTITIPTPTTVALTEITNESGTLLGYTLTVGDKSTTLYINDVLPISSVSFIPSVYYDGIEAVEFPTYDFSAYRYTSTTAADTTFTTLAATYYSEAAGVANYYVNPASASDNQIESAIVLTTVAENKTRAVATSDITSVVPTLSAGKLSVAIRADLSNAEDGDSYDMFAVQLTTTTGSTFTTPYFAAVRASSSANFTLKDTEATPNEFSSVWATVKAQAAAIDAENEAAANNNVLVQEIAYSDAIEGVDLNDYVKVYMGDKLIEAEDLAANNLKISYVLCKDFTVNGTNQINYAQLSGSTLTGYNYGGQEKSLIGKTPIVKVILNETTNKVTNNLTNAEEDAVVAVAYVKILYVGDAVEAADPYFAAANTLTHTWDGCVTGTALDYTTTYEYMSTKVYTLTGNADNLDALSKETFTTIYKLNTSYDLTNVEGIDENYSRYAGNCTIAEVAADDNADNKVVRFTFTADQLTALNKLMAADEPVFTYTFYAVYEKQAAYAVASSQYAVYPEIVLIPYTVTISGYPTDGNAKANISTYFVDQVFDADGYAVCKGTKYTSNGAALALDLSEAVNLTNFQAALYTGSSYVFELDEESAKIAAFDDELCTTGAGTGNWVILTEGLADNATATVTVNVYEETCENVRLDAGQVKIKFYSPATASLTSSEITITDVNGNKTAALNSLLKVISASTNNVLYENGAIVNANSTEAKNVLGTTPQITISKVADSADPTEYSDCFTLNSDNTVSWSLNGQNSIAQGKNATCKFQIVLTYGNAAYSSVISGCTESTQLPGCTYTAVVTVKVINPLDAAE